MSEYPSNSFREKESKKEPERKAVVPVVKGDVTVNKKRSFVGEFFTKDIKDIKEYIIFDVLLPKSKDVLFDLIDKGASMIIYGDGRGTSKKGNSSIIHYNSIYSKGSNVNQNSSGSEVRRSDSICQEIIFESPTDAEDVLNGLLDILDEYNLVTVADFYDLAGQKTTSTDGNWGWTNLSSAKTERIREGYIIKLPRPRAIN